MFDLNKNQKFLTSNGEGIKILGPTYIDSNCEIETPVRLNGGYFAVNRIGAFTYVSRGAVFKGVQSIGRFCSIATNVSVGYGNHNTTFVSTHPLFENVDFEWNENFHSLRKEHKAWLETMGKLSRDFMKEKNQPPIIGNDCWIGTGAFICRNVKVGDGAVIGAHAVVTKDVPPFAIVAGCPARIIRFRFPDHLIEKLLQLKWWEYGPNILAEIRLNDIESACSIIEERIASGFPKYFPEIYLFDNKNKTISLRGK